MAEMMYWEAIRRAHDDHKGAVRVRYTGCEPFAAVDDVGITVPDNARLDICGIRAGRGRFCHCKAGSGPALVRKSATAPDSARSSPRVVSPALIAMSRRSPTSGSTTFVSPVAGS